MMTGVLKICKKETIIMAEEKKKSQKRGIIIAFIVMVGVIVLFYASGPIMDGVSSFIKSKKEKEPTSDYMDHIKTYTFAPSAYGEDIYADEDYMKLDRYISYKNGPDTFTITDGDYAKYGVCIEFFAEYFESVKLGQYEDYDKYFTDEYFKNQSNKEMFAPQKIYDILVEETRSEIHDDGTESHFFYVDFKIFKNDGSFRNDIGSDMSRTVVYELVVDNDGNVLINYIGR